MTVGRVYKIVNKDESIIYVGATIQKLSTRFSMHYRRWIAQTAGCCAMVYHSFRDHGLESFKIEFTDRRELLQLENRYISDLECCNRQNAYRSPEEKMEQKQRYQMKTLQKRKEKIDCDCGGTYSQGPKQHHFTLSKKRTSFRYCQSSSQPEGTSGLYLSHRS
jgi:hypothetical protein